VLQSERAPGFEMKRFTPLRENIEGSLGNNEFITIGWRGSA
jgi:hypothetical protein